VFLGPRGLLIEPAQRRAAITGQEPRRVQTCGLIQAALIHQNPQQGLHAGDENPALAEQKFVV
jgi:hypothetical protein